MIVHFPKKKIFHAIIFASGLRMFFFAMQNYQWSAFFIDGFVASCWRCRNERIVACSFVYHLNSFFAKNQIN